MKNFAQHVYSFSGRMHISPPRKAALWAGTLIGLVVVTSTAGDVPSHSLPDVQASNVMALSLDQLLEVNVDKVYGASKFEQKVSRAPASVSLVTRDEITKQGYRTLADVLRSVNGFYVTDDRNYSYLGVRGFNRPGDYNSRVLLLVDGHRLNDSVYAQALTGTEGFLEVDAIERVEVIRGPSSSIYGDSAFFGVVNVITRRGRSVDGVEATVEVGDKDTYKAGLTFGKQFKNGVELFLSGSVYDSAGEQRIFFPEFNSPTNNHGVAVNSDADRAYHFFGSAGYGDFILSGGWSWREKVIPTASYATAFNDGGELTVDERAYVDLKCDHAFSEDLRLVGHVAYDAAYYRGEYPYADAASGRILNLDDARGEWLSTDWQLNWRLAGRHTLIFGGDYREHLTMQQGNMDAEPPAVHLDDRRGGRNAGVFAQAELSLRTNLLLNAGVRLDHYSTFGESANPRLGLIWQPWTETTFKALYGEAFRAPNAYELYYSYPGQAKANPELKPETIRTYELVWEQSLARHLRFTAAGYFYEVHNLTSQVLDPADNLTVFRNAERVQARGIELGLERHGPHGLVARLSYALQRTEDAVTGWELSNSPEHIAKLNLIAPLWNEKIFAGFDLQYYSGVRTVTDQTTDGVFFVNATVFSRQLVHHLDASVSVYNLFDERRGFSASTEHALDTIPLPGRSVRVKLTYHF